MDTERLVNFKRNACSTPRSSTQIVVSDKSTKVKTTFKTFNRIGLKR